MPRHFPYIFFYILGWKRTSIRQIYYTYYIDVKKMNEQQQKKKNWLLLQWMRRRWKIPTTEKKIHPKSVALRLSIKLKMLKETRQIEVLMTKTNAIFCDAIFLFHTLWSFFFFFFGEQPTHAINMHRSYFLNFCLICVNKFRCILHIFLFIIDYESKSSSERKCKKRKCKRKCKKKKKVSKNHRYHWSFTKMMMLLCLLLVYQRLIIRLENCGSSIFVKSKQTPTLSTFSNEGHHLSLTQTLPHVILLCAI